MRSLYRALQSNELVLIATRKHKRKRGDEDRLHPEYVA